MKTLRVLIKGLALLVGAILVFIGGLLDNADSTFTMMGIGLALIAFALLIDELAGIRFALRGSVQVTKAPE